VTRHWINFENLFHHMVVNNKSNENKKKLQKYNEEGCVPREL